MFFIYTSIYQKLLHPLTSKSLEAPCKVSSSPPASMARPLTQSYKGIWLPAIFRQSILNNSVNARTSLRSASACNKASSAFSRVFAKQKTSIPSIYSSTCLRKVDTSSCAICSLQGNGTGTESHYEVAITPYRLQLQARKVNGSVRKEQPSPINKDFNIQVAPLIIDDWWSIIDDRWSIIDDQWSIIDCQILLHLALHIWVHRLYTNVAPCNALPGEIWPVVDRSSEWFDMKMRRMCAATEHDFEMMKYEEDAWD